MIPRFEKVVRQKISSKNDLISLSVVKFSNFSFKLLSFFTARVVKVYTFRFFALKSTLNE